MRKGVVCLPDSADLPALSQLNDAAPGTKLRVMLRLVYHVSDILRANIDNALRGLGPDPHDPVCQAQWARFNTMAHYQHVQRGYRAGRVVGDG